MHLHLSFAIASVDVPFFIEHWSAKYSYNEHKYDANIRHPLTAKSLKELFEWKNGTGSVIAGPKLKSILTHYKHTYTGDKVARYLNHKQPGGAIWNIFYLHCLEPEEWPIFDQHTFRAMHYIQTGSIEEIGRTNKQIYQTYNVYRTFLKSFGLGHDQRSVDRALFSFGQFLKIAKRYA